MLWLPYVSLYSALDSESSSDSPAIGLKRVRARPIKVLIAEVGVHFSSHDWQIEYVLHHARLLIVRFFNEKRVILDALGQRL